MNKRAIAERQKLNEELIQGLRKEGIKFFKEWIGNPQENFKTKKAYKGGNQVKLAYTQHKKGYKDNRWITFKQAQAVGGHVKKGEHGYIVEFWQFLKRKDKDSKGNEIVTTIPLVKLWTVFNGDQIEGMPKAEEKNVKTVVNEDIQFIADTLIKSSKCRIEEIYQDQAFYSPMFDKIVIPTKEQFITSQSRLGTLIHEMAHSTSHKDRLNRQIGGAFGTVEYAKEELVAEITSLYTQSALGIDVNRQMEFEHQSFKDNSQAYINGWIKRLESDPNAIYQASSYSSKACDYILKNYYQELEKSEKQG